MKKVEYIPGSWPLRDLAVKHSLYEAIIIQFFQYFIKIHQRENRNFINGRTWNWISVKNLSEYLGFLSEKQVRCSFDRLIKKEVLITARYNTNKYDKTMWYAFNKEQEYLGENTFESDSKNGRSKRQKRLNEVPDSAKRIAPEGEPIPLNNQFKNTIRSSTDSDILFVKNLFKEYAENSNPHQGSEIGEILKHIEDPRDEFTKEILGNHFILFKQKDIVSGDFYWATKVNNFQIVCVADCTGHGVPGAFMSMLGISILNEIVRKENTTNASEILNKLREYIISALKQSGETENNISNDSIIQDGMDISLCVINVETNILQFAGANNSLLIARNNNLIEIEEYKGNKMPIAIHSEMNSFSQIETQLYPGDTIYLMSDGFEDQFGGENNKKFKSKQLKDLLVANSTKSMNHQKEILETILINWIGKSEQIDDITIVGIKT